MTNTYEKELLAFEPKMRSMVHNSKRGGVRYNGYDEDDLVQELFIEGMRIRDKYDPSISKLNTFWYTWFRGRLRHLARDNKKYEPFCGTIESVDATGVSTFSPGNALVGELLRVGFVDTVDAMLHYLQTHKPRLAVACRALFESQGDTGYAAKIMGVSCRSMNRYVLRIRELKDKIGVA